MARFKQRPLAEKIMIMMAAEKGLPIESRAKTGKWLPVKTEPSWNWAEKDYRVKGGLRSEITLPGGAEAYDRLAKIGEQWLRRRMSYYLEPNRTQLVEEYKKAIAYEEED